MFWPPFIATVLAACVTTTGLLIIRKFEDWAEKNSVYFSSFAAGVLISVSFLHIIPKSFSMNGNAPVFLLLGYLLLYSFNRFIAAYVCDKPDRAQYSIGLVLSD